MKYYIKAIRYVHTLRISHSLEKTPLKGPIDSKINIQGEVNFIVGVQSIAHCVFPTSEAK